MGFIWKSKLRICDNQLFYQRRYLVRHLLRYFPGGHIISWEQIGLQSQQSQPGKQIPFNQTSSVLYTEPGIKETGFWALPDAEVSVVYQDYEASLTYRISHLFTD